MEKRTEPEDLFGKPEKIVRIERTPAKKVKNIFARGG